MGHDRYILQSTWKGSGNSFLYSYTFEQTIYDIKVINPDAISHGDVTIKINGIETDHNKVHMISGQGIQHVEVEMKNK